MPKDFYPDLAAILRENGWLKIDNAKGSHERWKHPASGRTVIVPRTKSRHTANVVLKQAGLGKRF